ncbi:MAG TPA: phospholipase [Thermoanaerobaculia bacterium]|nr:phospholipase [Thermoanaerobaculia bacterium]
MIVRTIETPTHGRVLVEDRGADRFLVGFHGYAESAETNLEQLETIPGIAGWNVASVQALHPFYTRSGSIVASWMTSLDRELAIADNVAYVRQVVEALGSPRTLVFLGFSQGATMAARAAAYSANPAGLILLGGDVPDEIRDDPAAVLPPMLLARGVRDEWYTDEKFKKDLNSLQGRTRVTPLVFEGGHEWTDEFRVAAAGFLGTVV